MPTNTLHAAFSMEAEHLRISTARRAQIRRATLLGAISLVGSVWVVAVAVMVMAW